MNVVKILWETFKKGTYRFTFLTTCNQEHKKNSPGKSDELTIIFTMVRMLQTVL